MHLVMCGVQEENKSTWNLRMETLEKAGKKKLHACHPIVCRPGQASFHLDAARRDLSLGILEDLKEAERAIFSVSWGPLKLNRTVLIVSGVPLVV